MDGVGCDGDASYCIAHIIQQIVRQIGMVNVVDIVAAIVIAIVVFAVSFYLFAMYCHPQERGFGTTLPPKILVILSQALAWGQLLLLPLDLSLTQSDPSSNFLIAYEVIYSIIFAMVAFLNPLAMNFYESDESDSFLGRLGWSVLYSLIVSAVWAALIFISYVWLGVYPTSSGGEERLNAGLYLLVAMGLVGWVLLAFNGGIGLVYLPFDLITAFIDRPKHLTPEQAFTKKQQLQTRSSTLITEGQKLQQKQRQVGKLEGGWFSRKRGEAKFNKLLQGYKKEVNRLEEDHEIFDTELKIKGTHPIVYVVSLIAGVVGVVASVFWFVQILGTMILKNGSPIFLFMDQWLSSLSSSSVAFLATILYALLVLYLQACLAKGNTIFGIRIPFVLKIHPLILNKTFMNSLLFNANLMLLASMATTLLALWAFPTYLGGSSLGRMSSQGFDQLPLFSAVYGKRIPMIVMEAVAVLTVVVIGGGAAWRKWRGKSKQEKEK